jgi:hypothetical protein
MKVYTIWTSEDEGFRFPATNVAYSSLDMACMVAAKHGAGTEFKCAKKDLHHLAAPNAQGEVVKVFCLYDDRIVSMKDALEHVSGKSSLYAIDWLFIIEMTVE